MTSDCTDLFVLPFYKSNSHANFSNLRPVLFNSPLHLQGFFLSGLFVNLSLPVIDTKKIVIPSRLFDVTCHYHVIRCQLVPFLPFVFVFSLVPWYNL